MIANGLVLPIITLVILSGVTNASLIRNIGEGTVYDDATLTYWYSDLSDFQNKTLPEIDGLIDGLNGSYFGGYASWHLASQTEIEGLFMNDLLDFPGLFTPTANMGQKTGFFGRYDDGIPVVERDGWAGVKVDGITSATFRIAPNALGWEAMPRYGAWVTTDAIPEPTSLLMLGLGFLGLAVFRKRLKN